MKSLDILLLTDDRPGHYHLAQGVIAALERWVDIKVTRIDVQRRWWTPGRLLSKLVNNACSEASILKLGYGIRLENLKPADLVISAGGNTLAANIAASRALKAENIFIGSLRRFKAEDFSVVITSYQRFAHLPRHLACLKPCTLDPDTLGRPAIPPRFDGDTPPKTAGLLLGGNTPDYKYTTDEWQRLGRLIDDTHQAWGTQWLVSNSRRTPDTASNYFATKALLSDSPMEFIDYRIKGPGSLHHIFTTTDIIACTEDSSTMISEAIAAKLPVIGLTPKTHKHTPQELEYRQYLEHNNWTRTLAITALGPQNFARTLSQIIPMRENHLDLLAQKLKQRLPDLLSHSATSH